MITQEQLDRIEHKLDLIIDHFGITDLPGDMKHEIGRKVVEFKSKRQYNGGDERAAIRKR